MSKEAYALRLKSPAWRAFSLSLRNLAGNRCQLCGTGETELHCHHMRYDSKGTSDEWAAIIVLCSGCHGIYHDACPLPPRRKRSRLALCNEVAQVLLRAKVDVGFFLNHGEALNQHWLVNPVVSDGLVNFVVSPKGAKREKVKHPRLSKAERRALKNPAVKAPAFQVRSPKAISREWKPDCSLFTREQALAFVQNPGSKIFQTQGFIRKYKIPDPLPRKWTRRLRDSMISHFQIGKYARTTGKPAYMSDALDMIEAAISNE